MKNIKEIAVAMCAVLMSAVLGCTILAWTEPNQTPPSANVPAPINSGPITQTMNAYLNIIGNVGIGTTNPAVKKLEVAGDAKSTRFCLGSGVNERCCSTWSQCFCTPSTCVSLDMHCGIVNDGCGMGGTVNCGNCSSGYSCSSGTCVAPPAPAPPSSTSTDDCYGYHPTPHCYTTVCKHCTMQYGSDGFPLGVGCYTTYDSFCATGYTY